MDLENPIVAKSLAFALRIIKLYRYLVTEHKEYTLSRELLQAGTQIGKHVVEAVNGESRATFTNQMGIALRKTSESEYWLVLLHYGEFINEKEFESIEADRKELAKMLTKIVKTSKGV